MDVEKTIEFLTEENLNALIKVVDEVVRSNGGGRGGRRKPDQQASLL
jgi:hypothetical protein